jgi:predicted transcriptional regulator
MNRKRERVELIHDILQVVQDAGGRIKPTHLLYKANLSHDALKRYVSELMGRGLLIETEHKGKKAYELTPKGHAFLQEYRQFKNFSDAFGI